MKIMYKRIISFFLIFTVLTFSFSLTVNASDTSHGGGGSSRPDDSSDSSTDYEPGTAILNKKWDELNVFERITFNLKYACSQIGAVYNGDFAQYLANDSRYNEYVNDLENPIYNEETDTFSLSEDLVTYIKQALQEYSEETNGFWLVPTTSMRALNPAHFGNKDAYITLQNLINTHGIISCNMEPDSSIRIPMYGSVYSSGYDGFMAADFSSYIEPGYDLVCTGSYDPLTATKPITVNVYDNNWNKVTNISKYTFNNTIYNNASEGSLFSRTSYSNFYVNYPKYNYGTLYINSSTISSNHQWGMLISKNGERLRIFKSLTALKVYDSGQRTVYFGKDFYDKEPAELTVSIDDLEKYLNTDYTDYFDRISQQIAEQGGNLSEADVENIVDSVIASLKDIQGGIGDVNDSVNNLGPKLDEQLNILQKIYVKLCELDVKVEGILSGINDRVNTALDLSGIESRLDSILAQLGIISGQLDDITAEEFESKVDESIDNMQSEFGDIADLAKTKFPLSLPWDMYNVLNGLSGNTLNTDENNNNTDDNNNTGENNNNEDSGGGSGGSSRTASPPEAVALLLDEEPDTFIHTTSLASIEDSIDYSTDNSGIALYAAEEDTENSSGGGGHSSDIPIRGSDSGSHTSAGGYEHGGGGHSRWGAWLSDTGAPIFYVPVEFSHSMGIGGLLIIDLSGFETIHLISRIMVLIIFCVNLVHLTFKAVAAGKDILSW